MSQRNIIPWPSLRSPQICWACRLVRQRQQNRRFTASRSSHAIRHQTQTTFRSYRIPKVPRRNDQNKLTRKFARSYHSSGNVLRQATTTANIGSDMRLHSLEDTAPLNKPIKDHLREWQAANGVPNDDVLSVFENYPTKDDAVNDLSGLHVAQIESHEDTERTEDLRSLEDLDNLTAHLQPGDAIEVSRVGHESYLAVCVREVDKSFQFYTMDGKWMFMQFSSVTFVIPNFVDPSLLDKITPYLPTVPERGALRDVVARAQPVDLNVPREIGSQIVNQLRGLWKESETIYREYASILDNAFDKLADDKSTSLMSLGDITNRLVPWLVDRNSGPSPALLLAVRKALHHSGFGFATDARIQRSTGFFHVRSKKEVEAIELVQSWIRDHNEYLAARARVPSMKPNQHSQGAGYLAAFVDKAKGLIVASRQSRDPTFSGCVGPSRARFPITESSSAIRVSETVAFNDIDRLLISFLEAWALVGKFKASAQLAALAPTIVAATGCYTDHVHDRVTGLLFLQEIGVLSPYENRTSYDQTLMLPNSRLSRTVDEMAGKAYALIDSQDGPGFHDKMKHLRFDWGDMPVYCIDDVGAKEIDDGVSISSVPGHDDQQWVHIHIANPTAFFSKTHPLASLASHMVETVYMPEGVHSMLPQWSTAKYFSLGPNRPVLTISARLDALGNTLETKIQPGFVRNTVNLTPTTISAHFDGEKAGETQRLVVGGEVPSSRAPARPLVDTLLPTHRQDLTKLKILSDARYQKRSTQGGLSMDMDSFTVNVYESHASFGLQWRTPSRKAARFYEGDPVIELLGHPYRNPFSTSQRTSIVQEMMLLACEVAAGWCADRNIPVLYRGTILGSSRTNLNRYIKQIRDMSLEPDGAPPVTLAFAYMKKFGKVIVSTKARSHAFLGLDHYTKVTSPLRRYSDMITHWQIEAALRTEAKTGRKFDGGGAEYSKLPFSTDQVRSLTNILSVRERIIMRAKASSSSFWATQLIMRAFHYHEATLPDIFNVFTMNVYGDGSAVGRETVYGFEVLIRPPETESGPGELKFGDLWEAKLEHVDTFFRVVTMVPIRLIDRESDKYPEIDFD